MSKRPAVPGRPLNAEPLDPALDKQAGFLARSDLCSDKTISASPNMPPPETESEARSDGNQEALRPSDRHVFGLDVPCLSMH